MPDTTPVPPPVADLLARLAAGWSPLPYTPLAVISASHAEGDLTDRFLGARLDGSSLEIRFRGGFTDSMTALSWGSLALVTRNGERVEADVGGTSFRSESGTLTAELVVTSREWIAHPVEPAVLWVGRLTGARVSRWTGNLRIDRPEGEGVRSSPGHFVFDSPSARLYLVWPEVGDDPEWLAVEPKEVLEPRELWRDRLLLRVVLGSPIDVSSYVALDAAGETVGGLVDDAGVGGREVSDSAGALVPLRPTVRFGKATWAAPMFQRLTSAYAMDGVPDAITTALFRYGHTLPPMDVDTEYVVVSGAVWLLVRALAEDPSGETVPASDVMDELAVAESALRHSDLDALRGAVFRLATRLAGGRERELLMAIDEESGAIVHDEVLSAWAVWDRGTLRPSGAAPTEHSALEGFVRVQRMRRAFAVLLAHAVGYGGPLHSFRDFVGDGPFGWLPDPNSDPDDEALAAARYLASAETPVSSVWPDFALPEVPDTPVLRAVVAFADGLRSRTRGAVSARLRSLPRRHDEPLRLSFRLLLTAEPSVHVALFALQVDGDAVTVQGWEDGGRDLSTPEEVTAFGAEVARSDAFRYQVDRLLLIGDDVRRGEASSQV